MQLISTHISADFDAFASVLAARLLHPQARIFFPGSREESVRRFEATGLVSFEELKQRQVEPQQITRLILCDIRHPHRIGVVADWLAAHPGIEIYAYDHHPASPDDLPLAGGRIDPSVGSTATLMVEELEGRGLPLTPAEATALAMGIYEDTGSLSFASTSPRDFAAASRLLERGADLVAVRRYALRRLDATRLEILHRMTRELRVFRIRGHRVGIVALELGRYVDELAPLVNRCLESFELPMIFALFGEEDRVTVIARGDVPRVDLGGILAEVAAGGGHATAAAGRIKGSTVLEAREALLAYLERALPPAAVAGELMIEGFFSLPADLPVAEAKERLNARQVNAAPVADPESGRLVGAVTRQLLDAAIQHRMEERPVERVMTRELEWVAPDAAAEGVAERILERHPRFVLVGDPREGRALGLITRMQVLRHLHGRLSEIGAGERVDRRAREERQTRREVSKLLEERLSPPIASRVATVARVARRHAIPVYLVGGLVRDLLLGRENRDLDLVVEGDGLYFARLLAAELGGRAREHEAFLTAVVVDPEGFHVDVATARSEFYRSPAALPEVQTSPLRQDLYRRDFTINTLAIRLGPGDRPELIDYFGGRRDLEDRTLRVLHSLSFIDDPTRVLRAVRLEQRLGFEISPETLELVRVALAEGIFDRLSGSRLRDELILILEDPAVALRGIQRLEDLGVLAALHPRLELGPVPREHLRQALAAWDWFQLEGLTEPRVELWRLLSMALSWGLEERERQELAERLMLAGEDMRLLVGFAQRVVEARRRLEQPGLAPHRASLALGALAGEEQLLVLAAGDETVRTWVRRELCELRHLALRIRGADLLAAGAEPGPPIGRALAATRAARLDGRIGPDEELAFALAALEEEGSPASPPREEEESVRAPGGRG